MTRPEGEDIISVPSRVLLGIMQAVAGQPPRDAMATVSTVVSALLWDGPVPRLESAGTAPSESVVGEDHCLSVEDVASRTGASVRSIRRAAERGTLTGAQPDGPGTAWRFTPRAADEWKAKYVTQAATARRKPTPPADPVAAERARFADIDTTLEVLYGTLAEQEELLHWVDEAGLHTEDDVLAPDLAMARHAAAEKVHELRARIAVLRPERNGLLALLHLHDARMRAIASEQAGIAAREVQAEAVAAIEQAAEVAAKAIARSKQIAPTEPIPTLLRNQAAITGTRAFIAASAATREHIDDRRAGLAQLEEEQ